jgi:hypothetical protein
LATPSFCCVLVFSSLFIAQLFLWGAGSVCPGGSAGLSQGWLGEYCMTLGAHLLVCWMSPKQDWSQGLVVQQPSCFLSVMWCEEAFYRLGIQVLKFWFSLLLYFCQVWLQCLSKVLESQSSCCLLLHPSHHLGSLMSFLHK